MITLFGDNKEIPVEWVEFSDGALTCKVDKSITDVQGTLHFNVCTTTPCKQVREEVELLYNALCLLGCDDLNRELHLHYLPYARADRMFVGGNPEPLNVFIESTFILFEKVHLYDVHNISAAESHWVCNTCVELNHTDQTSCFQYACKRHGGYVQTWDYVIAPDKGAKDKAQKIANVLGVPCVQATKERDVSTGRITSTSLDATLPVGSRVIIVDDLLDGGGTFIPLAEELVSQGCTVDLYVTHLIAAKGLDLFKGLIDNLYCYQTVGKYVNKTDVMNFNLGK